MDKLIILIPILQLVQLHVCKKLQSHEVNFVTVCFQTHDSCNDSNCSDITNTDKHVDYTNDLKIPNTKNVTLKCEKDEHVYLHQPIMYFSPNYISYNTCMDDINSHDYCKPYMGCARGICCEKCCDQIVRKLDVNKYTRRDVCREVKGECVITLTRQDLGRSSHYRQSVDYCKASSTCYTELGRVSYSCVKIKSSIGFSLGVSIAILVVIVLAAVAAYMLVCRKKPAVNDNLQSPAERDIQYAVSYSSHQLDSDDNALIAENT